MKNLVDFKQIPVHLLGYPCICWLFKYRAFAGSPNTVLLGRD